MRVLYLTDGLWPDIGGVEVLTEAFLPAMRHRGHEFCVVSSVRQAGQPPREVRGGIDIHRFPFHKALKDNDLRLMKSISDGMKKVRHDFAPDVIHLNVTGLAPFYFLLSAEHGPPVVGVIHALPPPEVERRNPVIRRTLARLDWVVGVSHAILDDALPSTRRHGRR